MKKVKFANFLEIIQHVEIQQSKREVLAIFLTFNLLLLCYCSQAQSDDQTYLYLKPDKFDRKVALNIKDSTKIVFWENKELNYKEIGKTLNLVKAEGKLLILDRETKETLGYEKKEKLVLKNDSIYNWVKRGIDNWGYERNGKWILKIEYYESNNKQYVKLIHNGATNPIIDQFALYKMSEMVELKEIGTTATSSQTISLIILGILGIVTAIISQANN